LFHNPIQEPCLQDFPKKIPGTIPPDFVQFPINRIIALIACFVKPAFLWVVP
jgi:hypothetical protein